MVDFIKRQVAEFNTSQDTLRQLATMEWNIDEMFRMVYSGGVDISDSGGIKNLYHYLVFVYADRLWAFAWHDNKINITTKEEELTKLYSDWVINHKDKTPITLLTKLREYKRWLYELKQEKLKLGVPTRTESSAEERMKKAAGI